MDEIDCWSIEAVSKWVQTSIPSELDPHRVSQCLRNQLIDGQALLSLGEGDFRDNRLDLTIGQVVHLEKCVKQMQKKARTEGYITDLRPALKTPSVPMRLSSVSEDESYASSSCPAPPKKPPPPEYTKLLLASLYCIMSLLVTAFTMVLVHDRVPDMQRWPPLPDLLLDFLPYMPWAFEMCEVTAVFLGSTLGVILIFHKYRAIILRRYMLLSGTMFLLRCVTMLITSLSVPGTHLDCRPMPNATMASKLERAFNIWSHAGMSIQGVRTCGDYMFSGHTVVITLFNFFITEYSPFSFHMLHTITWVLNLFGIFFILGAHEHYSIDVFIAFYITSRLFLYYHSLANNRVLRQPDRRRTMFWFPMFGFFEAKVDGIVPNEYEWPLHYPKKLKHFMDSELFGNGRRKKKYE